MKELLQDAIDTFGIDSQHNVAVEELAELTKEICKINRNLGDRIKLAEEIADVEIMLEQLKMIHDVSSLTVIKKHHKLLRLEEKIKAFKSGGEK